MRESLMPTMAIVQRVEDVRTQQMLAEQKHIRHSIDARRCDLKREVLALMTPYLESIGCKPGVAASRDYPVDVSVETNTAALCEIHAVGSCGIFRMKKRNVSQWRDAVRPEYDVLESVESEKQIQYRTDLQYHRLPLPISCELGIMNIHALSQPSFVEDNIHPVIKQSILQSTYDVTRRMFLFLKTADQNYLRRMIAVGPLPSLGGNRLTALFRESVNRESGHYDHVLHYRPEPTEEQIHLLRQGLQAESFESSQNTEGYCVNPGI